MLSLGTGLMHAWRGLGMLVPNWSAIKSTTAKTGPMLQPMVIWKHWLPALSVVAVSISMGTAVAVVELHALFIALGLLFSLFILIDYRVGALFLIVLMPLSGSTIFPHQLLGITGLNPMNLLLIATLLSVGVRRIFVTSKHRFLPRDLLWLYAAPIAVAAATGFPHIGDIPSFFAATGELSFDSASGYIRDAFVRPMFLVLFAMILGSAVAESRDAKGYLIAGLVSMWAMILLAIVFYLMSGLSLRDISSDTERGFFSPMGLHANQLGRLYALGFALLIFSASAYDGVWSKLLIWATVALAGFSVILSFSRGGFLVVAVIGVLYLLSLPRRHLLPVLALVLPVTLVAMPHAVYDRITYGLGQDADLNTISSSRTEEIWEPLLPEILSNPLVGHGLSSILWSDAMLSGKIIPVTHPHNAYLKALLDNGIIGTALILTFLWRIWKRFRVLAIRSDLDPRLRALFAGASAALIGFSVGGVFGSSFDPIIEQVYLWFAVGLMYGVTSRLTLSNGHHG